MALCKCRESPRSEDLEGMEDSWGIKQVINQSLWRTGRNEKLGACWKPKTYSQTQTINGELVQWFMEICCSVYSAGWECGWCTAETIQEERWAGHGAESQRKDVSESNFLPLITIWLQQVYGHCIILPSESNENYFLAIFTPEPNRKGILWFIKLTIGFTPRE